MPEGGRPAGRRGPSGGQPPSATPPSVPVVVAPTPEADAPEEAAASEPAPLRPVRRPSAAARAEGITDHGGVDGDGADELDLFAEPDAVPAVRVRQQPAQTPWYRRVAFATTVAVSAAAIPALTYVGYQIIGDSTEGRYTDSNAGPTDPGYEAQVVSTPTAVAVQYGPDGQPVAATFLALPGGDDGAPGGAVMFVPLDTEPVVTNFGVNTIRLSYSSIDRDPAAAQVQMVGQIGRLVNVGIEETIRLDDDIWTQIVTPVGPLEIDYGDAIDLGNGTVIPAGPTTLEADQVGAYLAAAPEGISDLSRLDRHEMVWKAWLKAVRESSDPNAVPGEATSGMGRFARKLAAGDVTYETLPVKEVPRTARFRVDKEAVGKFVTSTIPSPNPGAVGQRFTVRLLNGVSPDAIPADLAREIVKVGGSTTILGNGPEFDTDETTITYRDEAQEGIATLLLAVLGGQGEVVYDPKAPDTIDFTIVLGRDLLGDDPAAGSPGSTTPSTTGGS